MISIAMIVGSLELNGISAVVINYCSNINLEKYAVKLLVGGKVDSVYRERCRKLGINIVKLPSRKKKTGAYCRALKKELTRGSFDIVHVHGNSATMAIELFIAKISGIKGRIAHCHNTTCEHKIMHILLKSIFNLLYTSGAACGKEAGEWLFGEKPFCVIPNGFNTEKFRFDKEKRILVRKELGITHQEVLGHVGKINFQKNQEFLLRIFERYASNHPNAVLLLVGDGPNYNIIKDLITKSLYRERIILYGETEMLDQMYMAMDVFVFPSKFEGLPIALLEAQMSGLPCVVSEVITQEGIISENVIRLSLDEPFEKWIEAIERTKQGDRESFYDKHLQKIKQYDITENVKILEKLYEDI